MKLLFEKFEKSLIFLLPLLCIFMAAQSSAAQPPNNQEQNSQNQSAIAPTSEPSDIVGKIDDYTITKEQLKKQMLAELYPREYNFTGEKTQPVDANSVLTKMIAEKAMIIEARKEGHLKDESNSRSLKRYEERRLVNLLVQNYLQQVRDKITATESEIQKIIQNDPNMDPNRAKSVIENTKARSIVSRYYKQIYEKSHVKKLSENYPEVIKIYDRLLNHPKVPQRLKYIRFTQINDEMTPEERNMVLATYDGGKVTTEDWFNILCELSPPSRPKNLNTPQGIDQLLERALMIPLYISQAKAQKLDQDENYLKQIRDYEDRLLLGTANREIYKQVQEPKTEEMVAYYNNHKEAFREGRLVKMDLIWCQDLETARQARAELDSGTDFESVKQKYSLEKKLKPYNTYQGSEGLFWQDLWQAEPNNIVGPIKGFDRGQIKWRIVKILDKKPGEIKDYSANMDNKIKDFMMNERREALLAKYQNELLKKYPHEIYPEKIKDIDPLDIP